MGKMYTLQPNESINDHVKDSMDIINHIVELSIGCMRDLANPHEGTFVDMTFNKFMRSLEHIRKSIQMLDELCDDLEEDKDEIRHEYEEKVIHHNPNIVTICGSMKYWEDMRAEYIRLTRKGFCVFMPVHEDRQSFDKDFLRDLHFKKIVMSGRIIVVNPQGYIGEDTKKEISFAKANQIPVYYTVPESFNNPANFCGNCKYFSIRPNDVGFCNNKNADPFIVDPDDASCEHFESNKPNVVIDKPEFPCCEHCSHEDCDDCTLCPF